MDAYSLSWAREYEILFLTVGDYGFLDLAIDLPSLGKIRGSLFRREVCSQVTNGVSLESCFYMIVADA